MSALFFGSLGAQSQTLAALSEVVILLPVFLILFTWRGFIQALFAKLVGDTTPEEDGFLSLNPTVHVDMLGFMIILAAFFVITAFFSSAIPRTVMLIMLVMMGVRWTYPVQIDDSRFTNYRLGGIVTTLAGAFSNFLLAFMSTGILKIIMQFDLPQAALMSFAGIFTTLISIAIFFGLIDLIPLPPFDGGRLLRYVLPYRKQHIVQTLEEYSFFIMLVLFFAPVISNIFFGGLSIAAIVIKKFFSSIFF
jgi:Zn-dependent protease